MLRFVCQEGGRPLLCHVRLAIGPVKWQNIDSTWPQLAGGGSSPDRGGAPPVASFDLDGQLSGAVSRTGRERSSPNHASQ
jgi:hypothetical protein